MEFENDPDKWVSSAACRNEDTEIFFILRGDPQQREKRIKAYQFCEMCSVRMECLNYAIINYELGIWGGTTDKDRRALRRTWMPLNKRRKRLMGYSRFV